MTTIQAVNYFIALLLICNPIGALPIFLKLTATDTYKERRAIAIKATFATFIILLVSTWLGVYLLHIFGIKVAAFQFTGGLVILILAFSMLRAEDSRYKQTVEEKQEAVQKDSIAITPLAIPLIAGPGAISSIIATTSVFPGINNNILITAIVLGVTLIMGSILFFAPILESILGRVGINIFTRIGGLIVASNALDSIARSVKEMFPILVGG
jgi:MarC family membrane protein